MTPRFWPLVGEMPSRLLSLAEGLVQSGHEVRVVSALWSRDWPRSMAVGCVPLVRLSGAPRGAWSMLRWMYALSRWLRDEHERLDGVLVAGLRQEAFVAIGQLLPRRSVVAIAGEEDLDWHRTAPFGSRIAARCREALAIVAASRTLADMLAQAGFCRDAIRVIRPSVPPPPPRGIRLRAEARAALAAANYDLISTDATSVAVAVGRLDDRNRIGDLVRAWRIVAARRPEARLWVVGDGPNREALYQQIGDLDLRFRVLLPGTFDCLDELWQAADLLLVPAPHAAPPLTMLQAMAAGLPVIAADCAAVREVGGSRTALLVPPNDIQALADAVTRLIDDPGAGAPLGAAAREQMRSAPDAAAEAGCYVELLAGLRNQGGGRC